MHRGWILCTGGIQWRSTGAYVSHKGKTIKSMPAIAPYSLAGYWYYEAVGRRIWPTFVDTLDKTTSDSQALFYMRLGLTNQHLNGPVSHAHTVHVASNTPL